MTTAARRPQSRRKAAAGPDVNAVNVVTALFRKHRDAKRTAAEAAKQADKLRDEIMPLIEKYGEAYGEKAQHLAIELPEEIDGCTVLVRRANKSPYIDVDKAEALAKAKGFSKEIVSGHVRLSFTGTPAETRKLVKLLTQSGIDQFEGLVFETEERFDQDRLMAYHQKHRDKLTEKELDDLFDEDVKYSFNPGK